MSCRAGPGLDTATRIVNRPRGDLWVESKSGEMCFTVLLPLTVIPALQTTGPDTDAR